MQRALKHDFNLTNPATINPPMVPCDVIEAIATLVANDQSSCLFGKDATLVTNFDESILSAGEAMYGGIYLLPIIHKIKNQ